MAEKLDVNALLERAEMTGRIFPMKPSWRRMQTFAGILTCLLIITIPMGIWIIVSARKARVGLTEEGFAFKYLTGFGYRWTDIESITLSSMGAHQFGGGLVGVAAAAAVSKKTQGLKGPLNFKLKGKKLPKAIPAHTIENSLEMARQMEQLSGIDFLPNEAPGA